MLVNEVGAVTVRYAADKLGRSQTWTRKQIYALVDAGKMREGGTTLSGAKRYWAVPVPRRWSAPEVGATVAVLYTCRKEDRCGQTGEFTRPQGPPDVSCYRPSGHTGRHYAAPHGLVVAVW